MKKKILSEIARKLFLIVAICLTLLFAFGLAVIVLSVAAEIYNTM